MCERGMVVEHIACQRPLPTHRRQEADGEGGRPDGDQVPLRCVRARREQAVVRDAAVHPQLKLAHAAGRGLGVVVDEEGGHSRGLVEHDPHHVRLPRHQRRRVRGKPRLVHAVGLH